MINENIQEEEIKEDYVSVKIAKLLEEKGFIGEVRKYYLIHEDGFSELFDKKDEFPSSEDVWIPAPTLNVACKWIRKKYSIIVETVMDDYLTTENGKLKITYSYTIWTFIQHLGETGLIDSRYDDRAFWQEGSCDSPEQATEAGILYVLENLI